MDKQLLQHLQQSDIKSNREARELNDRMNGMGAKVKRIESALASKSPGVTVETLTPFLKELSRDLDTIKQRLTALESGLRYRGVYDSTKEYIPYNFVTDNGSLWHCEEKTKSRPGTDSTWRLAAKKGTFS
jgi:hypothetical protein